MNNCSTVPFIRDQTTTDGVTEVVRAELLAVLILLASGNSQLEIFAKGNTYTSNALTHSNKIVNMYVWLILNHSHIALSEHTLSHGRSGSLGVIQYFSTLSKVILYIMKFMFKK